MKPFIKWAGGKRNLIEQIKAVWPSDFDTYYEPFLGGAAVFLEFLPDKAILSDLNSELVNFYRVVSTSNGIKMLHNRLKTMGNNKESFLDIRSWDRSDTWVQRSEIDRASRFIYLNKTSYNGLWRENSKGQFNTPYGQYENPCIDFGAFEAFADEVGKRKITIVGASYQDALLGCKSGDLVFLDPPYYPSSKTSSFSSYTRYKFGALEHMELANYCREMNNKGIKFILTNSFTEETKSMYFDFNVNVVETSRSIDRGMIQHVIVWNY